MVAYRRGVLLESLSGEAGHVVDDWREVGWTPQLHLRQTLPVGLHHSLYPCSTHTHTHLRVKASTAATEARRKVYLHRRDLLDWSWWETREKPVGTSRQKIKNDMTQLSLSHRHMKKEWRSRVSKVSQDYILTSNF